MTLSKKTVNAHNLRRADVFAKHGLGDHDVRYAHPAFLGYGEAECILCGKQNLKWNFAIRFDAPDLTVALGKIATGLVRTEEVTLSVVGSTCINDWLDAVPESTEKLEALKRWDHEMKKMNMAKKKKVCEDLCTELCETRGIAIPEDHSARDVAYKLYKGTGSQARGALTWFDRNRLNKNTYKVYTGTCARKTAQTWISNLETVLDAQAQIDAAVTPPEPTANNDDDNIALLVLDGDLVTFKATDEAELIQRARNAWEGGEHGLDDWEQTTLMDIGAKVIKYKSFASGKQRKFYAKLLAKLEAAVPGAVDQLAAVAPVPVAAALPGNADYTSASGIAGARY